MHHDHRPTGQAGGHDKHAGHSVAMFRDKFWLSLALTIPIVLLSPEVQGWLGYAIPAIPGIEYVPAILGTIIFFYGGLVFIRGAQGELADRKPGMMTLISLAIVVAFVTSWAGTLGLFDVEIWWELATLITIMLLGHWLEMRSIAQAQGALSALAALLPDTAERVTADGTEEGADRRSCASATSCSFGPAPGCPADGVVVEGAADVDESMITGESRAVAKAARRHRHRRHRRRRRLAPGQGHRDRRPDGPVGDHASGRAGAGIGLAGAGPGRPGGGDPVLCRAWRGRDHAGRLVAARRPGGCAGPNGDRARHRLPACPRPRDPAGHRHLHLARRPERPARQGPAGARASPDASTW